MLSYRPLKFKLDAFRHYMDGHHPQRAFEMASSDNGGIKLTGCMTDRAYSSSYMSDDVKNSIRRLIASGDAETLAYFKQWDLELDF